MTLEQFKQDIIKLTEEWADHWEEKSNKDPVAYPPDLEVEEWIEALLLHFEQNYQDLLP